MQKLSIFKALLTEDLSIAEQMKCLESLSLEKVTAKDIVACVDVVMSHATLIEGLHPHTIDMGGTGGDGANTFNITTAAAFVVAGAGFKVAKLETPVCQALKIQCRRKPDDIKQQLAHTGMAFIRPADFHPHCQHLQDALHALKKRGKQSLLDLIMPLCHPAQPKRRVLGVFDVKYVATYAAVLDVLGVEKAAVVHGKGLDEMTLADRSAVAYLDHGEVHVEAVSPESVGFKSASNDALKGGDVLTNATLVQDILSNKVVGSKRDVVVLNAAIAIQLAYLERIDLVDAKALAADALESGRALRCLQALQR